jgi:hypothetical protein
MATWHVDADQAAYAYANEKEPIGNNIDKLRSYLERLQKRVSSDKMFLYVTLGSKGGREEIASVRPYQGSRVHTGGEEKRERIRELREWMGALEEEIFVGMPCRDREADDLIATMMHLDPSGVVMSRDKDLRMIPGKHYDEVTGEMWKSTELGALWIEEKGKVKKVKGCGKLWFFQQMLQGDPVDDIPGLPMLTAEFASTHIGSKSTSNVPCGPMRAYKVLQNCETLQNACLLTALAYKSFYGTEWMERFMEQAFLLFLQRDDDIRDVEKFLKQFIPGVKFSKRQEGILRSVRRKNGTTISKEPGSGTGEERP